MKIGIYSGSFNPVHLGHIALADYLVAHGVVDEVWLIRSPQNPFKQADCLLSDEHRAEMLRLAVEGHRGLKICTIEDNLPKPNYTINTLTALRQLDSTDEFHMIIGADNWEVFDKWRDWEIIIRDFHLIVYPRPGYAYPTVDHSQYPNVMVVDAPQFDYSSTAIRAKCRRGEPVDDMVAPNVLDYIINNELYTNE